MAKEKTKKIQHRQKQKYRLKGYTLPTPDKSADIVRENISLRQ